MELVRRSGAAALLMASLGALISTPAASRMGEWVVNDVVDIRLVATNSLDGEQVLAALEIVLQPGWKTYWRTPGLGGLPPIIDFSKSRNLATAEVSFPPPHRYNDGYTVTNVYEGRVIFPIVIEPSVDEVPVTVDIVFDLGVCETICLPMRVETSVTISADEHDAATLEIFEEGLSGLPTVPIAGEFEIVEITPIDSANGDYLAEAVVPQGFGSELFVEGPWGWIPIAPHQVDRNGNRVTFAFGFEYSDGTNPAGAPVTFTLVSGGAAIEQNMHLP